MAALYVSFETKKVQMFFQDFQAGKYGSQRLGQAFYNEFNLQKMVGDPYGELYQLDDNDARRYIRENFHLS